MTHRPNVERAVAQVATFRGRRLKLRYRGETKNSAWLKYRTAALNLRNLTGKGLTRRDGAWALASPALPAKPGKRTHASGPAVRQPRLRQPASP
jgi:hypothetical protein